MIIEYTLIACISALVLICYTMITDRFNELDDNPLSFFIPAIFFPLTTIIILKRIYNWIEEWL
jgi:hypothetical protein